MLLRSLRDIRLTATTIPLLDGIFGNKHDITEGQKSDAFYHTEEAENIDGWQRLRNLFRKQEDDVIHPAVVEMMQNTIAGLIGGGLYGAIGSSRTTFINFIENNEATQFRNHLDAKRQLSDAMFKSYLKGFGQWGTKVCLFVGVFTSAQLALSVYQNKYSFWHYSAGGATAGALYKFQLGPKGMISGAVFGGLFGTIYGTIRVTLLKLTNQTEEDLQKFRQSLKIQKDEFDLKISKKADADKMEEEIKQMMLDVKAHIVAD